MMDAFATEIGNKMMLTANIQYLIFLCMFRRARFEYIQKKGAGFWRAMPQLLHPGGP